VLFNTVLFTGNANPVLAQEIASHLNVELGRASVGRFSDGEVTVEIRQNVRARDVFVVQPTCTPTNENLMELFIMVDALKRASARRITAVMPYYGYARQDRRPRSTRVPISAKVVANMLETVGVERVLTMDLHADQIQGFFDIPVDNIYASPVLLSDLKSKNYRNLVVISPDVGGVVRARALAKQLDCDLAIIDKRRPDGQRVGGHARDRRDRRPQLRDHGRHDRHRRHAGEGRRGAEGTRRGQRLRLLHAPGVLGPGGGAHPRLADRRGRRHQHHSAQRRGACLPEDPATERGLPVRRDHPPHQRRRVGDLVVR
jgi:phosphoribosylpyrophosphate synthetase